MISSVYTYKYYKRDATSLCQKNSKMILSRKEHLKVIEILDWHSRKSSSNSLYFHGDICSRFHILLSSEKTQEN